MAFLEVDRLEVLPEEVSAVELLETHRRGDEAEIKCGSMLKCCQHRIEGSKQLAGQGHGYVTFFKSCTTKKT